MNSTWQRVSGVATIALVALGLLPVLAALVASFTPESRIFGAPSLDLRALTLDHYRALFETREFWLPIRNSLVVAFSTTVLAVAIGGLCAYAIARLTFRGKPFILAAVLAVSVFPQIAIVSPLYLVLREVHLIDTYPGLVLPYLTFATPLSVWLLAGFFRQLPVEIEEAALVDGASRLQAFYKILLPIALPGVMATAILTFLYCWNEFLFALSFTLGPERQTVPVAIALFRGQYQVPWGEVLAAAVVATVPVALIVMVAQRRIVSGLTAGAVKG
jgi:ABC-type glycerol-3-phosphate transport system permease component